MPRKGRLQRQQLVERRPERVDVGPVVDRRSPGQRCSGDMYAGVPTRSPVTSVAVPASKSGEPEVRDPGLAPGARSGWTA